MYYIGFREDQTDDSTLNLHLVVSHFDPLLKFSKNSFMVILYYQGSIVMLKSKSFN